MIKKIPLARLRVLFGSLLFLSIIGTVSANPLKTERNHASASIEDQSTVTGTVTDADNGMPIPGVNVTEKGTNNGVTTDFDGNYSIDVADGATLVFSYVGFTTTENVVNNQTTMDVILSADVQSLNEVVVVGYGTQRKQDLTGAVSVVKTDELVQQPTAQITNQLQGRVSGVTITGGGQPGEAPQIKIRGANTFGNNTPLYVVDGIPISNINDLNPNDVETMQVLKDAASASIYGSRAANGVIIITTKKGKGRMKVTYDTYYGTQLVKKGNPWDILNAQEMADLTFMAIRNTDPNAVIDHSQYGNGANPVLPNYIAPVGADTVDEALYNVNPNYTDPAAVNNFYRIVKEVIRKYPNNREQSAVIPVLDIAQRQNRGWLTKSAIEKVATTLGMSFIRVMEIATFYSMFNLQPIGENFIQICRTTPCWLRGSNKLLKVAKEETGCNYPAELFGT